MGTWATEEMVGGQRRVIHFRTHETVLRGGYVETYLFGRIHGTRGGPCPLDPAHSNSRNLYLLKSLS